MFRRLPAPGKPNPLLRLAATDANSSRNQQVFGVSLTPCQLTGAASRRDRAGWEERTRWWGSAGQDKGRSACGRGEHEVMGEGSWLAGRGEYCRASGRTHGARCGCGARFLPFLVALLQGQSQTATGRSRRGRAARGWCVANGELAMALRCAARSGFRPWWYRKAPDRGFLSWSSLLCLPRYLTLTVVT